MAYRKPQNELPFLSIHKSELLPIGGSPFLAGDGPNKGVASALYNTLNLPVTGGFIASLRAIGSGYFFSSKGRVERMSAEEAPT